MEELSNNPEALAIAAKAVKLATNFDIKPGEGMWDMLKKMSIEKMAGAMNISAMGEGFLNSINIQLTKIKK